MRRSYGSKDHLGKVDRAIHRLTLLLAADLVVNKWSNGFMDLSLQMGSILDKRVITELYLKSYCLICAN
jgi:hypothetical protein